MRVIILFTQLKCLGVNMEVRRLHACANTLHKTEALARCNRAVNRCSFLEEVAIEALSFIPCLTHALLVG